MVKISYPGKAFLLKLRIWMGDRIANFYLFKLAASAEVSTWMGDPIGLLADYTHYHYCLVHVLISACVCGCMRIPI